MNSTLLCWCLQTIYLPIPVIPPNCKCWNKLFE
nr:MAG TPA_asm: Gal11 activator-binding domain (ABD1) [Caudoviricetes sp.]